MLRLRFLAHASAQTPNVIKPSVVFSPDSIVRISNHLAALVVLPGIHTQEKPNVRETPRFIEPLARLAVPPGVHTREKPAPLMI